MRTKADHGHGAQEMVDAERGAETGGASGGHHVRRAGDVVAHHFRRELAEEKATGVANPAGPQGPQGVAGPPGPPGPRAKPAQPGLLAHKENPERLARREKKAHADGPPKRLKITASTL